MERIIFLHIGFGKTGTTSIQHHLNTQRHVLSKYGILYPLAGQQNSGHHLLAKLGSNEIQDAVLEEYNKLLLEISSSDCQKIVLSSENYCFMSGQYVAHLREIFSEFEVKVIFYARPQVELIESTYLEWVKTGKKYTRTVDEFFRLHSHGFNFIERLEPWRNSFGAKNIMLRHYSSRIKNCDSRTDILEAIQAPENLVLEISTEGARNLNLSISPDVTELVYKIDQLQPEKKQRVEIINEILALTAKLDVSKRGSLMSEALAKEITEFYKSSNDELIAKYGAEASYV